MPFQNDTQKENVQKASLEAIRAVKKETSEPDPIKVPVNGEFIDLTIEDVAAEAKKIQKSVQKKYREKYKGDKLKMVLPHAALAKMMVEIGKNPEKYVDVGKCEKLIYSFIITGKDGKGRQTVEWAMEDEDSDSDSGSEIDQEAMEEAMAELQDEETPEAGPSGRRVGGTVSPDRVMAPRSDDSSASRSSEKRKREEEADSNGGSAV
ncbi:hypothetical protein PENSPDRAFT_672753, partial [Peniophora sp. CONT]